MENPRLIASVNILFLLSLILAVETACTHKQSYEYPRATLIRAVLGPRQEASLKVDGMPVGRSFSSPLRLLELGGNVVHTTRPVRTVFQSSVPKVIGGGGGNIVVVLTQSVSTAPLAWTPKGDTPQYAIVFACALGAALAAFFVVRLMAQHSNRLCSWLVSNGSKRLYIFLAVVGFVVLTSGVEVAAPFAHHDLYIDNATENSYIVVVDQKARIPITPYSHTGTSLTTGDHTLTVLSAATENAAESVHFSIERSSVSLVYNILSANRYTITAEKYFPVR